MSCPREIDVAVYVLGALDPPERLALESHLAHCEQCRAALTTTAGLPGLLARVPEPALGPDVADADAAADPPGTVLDGVVRRLRRRRRARVLLAAAAVVLAVLGGLALSPLVLGSTSEAAAREVALPATVGSPSSGLAGLVPRPWGTAVSLRCRTDPSRLPSAAPLPAGVSPPRTVYVLLVRTPDGQQEPIARWSPPPGQDVTVDAATDLRPDQVAGLEVRTGDGRTVMRS